MMVYRAIKMDVEGWWVLKPRKAEHDYVKLPRFALPWDITPRDEIHLARIGDDSAWLVGKIVKRLRSNYGPARSKR